MKFIKPISGKADAGPGSLAFKHDGVSYFVGEVRYVSDELAGYFCGVGWATAEGLETAAPDTSEKVLEVQNGSHVSSTTTL